MNEVRENDGGRRRLGRTGDARESIAGWAEEGEGEGVEVEQTGANERFLGQRCHGIMRLW